MGCLDSNSIFLNDNQNRYQNQYPIQYQNQYQYPIVYVPNNANAGLNSNNIDNANNPNQNEFYEYGDDEFNEEEHRLFPLIFIRQIFKILKKFFVNLLMKVVKTKLKSIKFSFL